MRDILRDNAEQLVADSTHLNEGWAGILLTNRHTSEIEMESQPGDGVEENE